MGRKKASALINKMMLLICAWCTVFTKISLCDYLL